jgi:hypothetical protein
MVKKSSLFMSQCYPRIYMELQKKKHENHNQVT